METTERQCKNCQEQFRTRNPELRYCVACVKEISTDFLDSLTPEEKAESIARSRMTPEERAEALEKRRKVREATAAYRAGPQAYRASEFDRTSDEALESKRNPQTRKIKVVRLERNIERVLLFIIASGVLATLGVTLWLLLHIWTWVTLLLAHWFGTV